MNSLLKAFFSLADLVLAPAVYPAGYLLKLIRRALVYMPLCKRVLLQVGVFPIRDHYYEPLFDGRRLRHPLHQERDLPGLEWNVEEQLDLLKSFCFEEEIKDTAISKRGDMGIDFDYGPFRSGDSEYWYSLIRRKKPQRVFEIGSGNSTLIAMKALLKNQEDIPGYQCKHLCIEPYETPWLEKTGAIVVRQRVEDVGKEIFSELTYGDILFIDSSHIIRPQGDVLFMYLALLPSLNRGVIVHIHDIFSPRDYLENFVINEVRFWNEQYLLEAFLTGNRDWKIIGALNYLHHNHFETLQEKCPFLTRDREPGSFYIEKIA